MSDNVEEGPQEETTVPTEATEGGEVPASADAGETVEASVAVEDAKPAEGGEPVEGGEPAEGGGDAGETVEGETAEAKGPDVEGEEGELQGEHVKEEGGEEVNDEESEYNEGQIGPEEQKSGEKLAKEEEVAGEEVGGEHVEGEEKVEPEKKEEKAVVEEKAEEEQVVEEPPPDPSAPLNLSDSKELIKPKFELRPDQLAEVEKLWELYQDYTPAYTDIKQYITEKELVYLLKSLLLMTYTPEQLQELIEYCVRPPDPLGHITYDQFLHMVMIRQRDLPVEEELRSAFQVLDPEKTGLVDREYLRDLLRKQGSKMQDKVLDNFMKEIDMSNDGTIGIEDAVGTICIDLNTEDIQMMLAALNPEANAPPPDDDD